MILGLVGIIIALVMLLQPVPPAAFESFPVTQYKDPHFPSNPLAAEDSKALLERFGQTFEGSATQEYGLLSNHLASLKKRADKVLVLYLNLLAQGDGQEVYLLPGDANPDNPEMRLPLSTVLKDLKVCSAAHKLLLLDVMKPIADPRLGTLLNDVPERVKAMVEANDDPHLLVLCACSPGQLSLVSEELDHSLFGYYLNEGLRGYARSPNGRVTAQNLAAFTRARVDRCSEMGRRGRQTPLLLGKGDFELLAVAAPPAPGPEDPSGEDKYPPVLVDGWQLRDNWRKRGHDRLVPGLVRNLEARLVRAEQNWRGDSKYHGQIEQDLRPQLAREYPAKLARAERTLPSLQLAPSLTRTPTAGKAPDQQLILRLNIQLDKFPAAGPAKAAQPAAASAKDDEFQKTKDEIVGKTPPAPEELARAIISVAADNPNLTPVHFRFLRRLLDSEKGVPETVETMFLRRLTDSNALMDLRESDENKRVFEALRSSMRVLRLGEEILAFDSRVFPWVQDLLQAAASKRREGENRLTVASFSAAFRPQDLELLWEEIEKNYGTIKKDSNIVQSAYGACDRGFALLPSVAPSLGNQVQLEPGDEKNWLDALRTLVTLYDQLGSLPNPAEGDGEARRRRMTTLEEKTQTLKLALDKVERRLTEDAIKRITDLSDIDLLLESTWPSASARQQLWDQRRRLARDLWSETRNQDEADNRNPGRSPRESTRPSDDEAVARELQRGQRRAQLALGLLELGGLPGVKTLKKELGDPQAPALHRLGTRLRQAWEKDIPTQLQELLKRGDYRAADRLSRIIHPSDRTPWSLEEAEKEPAVRLRRQEIEALRQWLADQYRQESNNGATPSAYQRFYEAAADRLR
jgi:hypothetical protein